MTRQKDLKRLVRARMTKTGEAYTAARAQVTRKAPPGVRKSAEPADAATPAAGDYAKLAGTSDAAIRQKTGCTWERWVKSLDYHRAYEMPHRNIAALVHEKYEIDGWWSQTVAVGYERIKGLRARRQQRDGTYAAGKSRTFNVPVSALFNAWANPGVRKRWLGTRGVKVRTATAPKSIRLGMSDGTITAVGFIAKGPDKSAVAIAQTKLPDRETADRVKQYWSDRLDALKGVLSE